MSICSDAIPANVTSSWLYTRGGCAVIPSLFHPDSIAELAAEAESSRENGKRTLWDGASGAEGRGGSPRRAFTTAPGGPVQWRLFSALGLSERVAQMCGLPAEPTGGGSYTHYERTGDFLDLHLDIVTCDIALITCLLDVPEGPEGGRLLVYPGHIGGTVADARAAGRSAARAAHLKPGDTAVLMGGIVPHEVTPMLAGQRRVISVMCFRLAAA